MKRPFSVVENKLFEADFFLKKLDESKKKNEESKFYFSAFLSAARSVTFCLQACLSGIEDFDKWYETKQADLKSNELAKFFVNARNISEKQGFSPLSIMQINGGNTEYLYYPLDDSEQYIPNGDLIKLAIEHLKLIVDLIFDCYEKFGHLLNPNQIYSLENITKRGQTVKDIEIEIWGYNKWTGFGLSEEEVLKYILDKIHVISLNELFIKYLGKDIK